MNMPTVVELMERYKTACDFKQVVDREAIVRHLTDFANAVNMSQNVSIRFIKTEAEIIKAAWGARDAWAAWVARAAWFARDARAARDARDARVAWDAWDAWVARDAWDARVARDVSWIGLTAISASELQQEQQFTIWYPVLQALEAGAWLLFFTDKEICVVTIPCTIHTDDRNRLHAENSAAIAWLDVNEYYWHGVRVSEDIILRPETITVERIENEANSEIRRVLVDRYGEGRYLEDSGAELLCMDEFGELYRKQQAGDEPIVMVKVLNSTPEPDGSKKTYWLSVPPVFVPHTLIDTDEIARYVTSHTKMWRSPKQAIAWTFAMSEDEYVPIQET